MHVQIVEFHLEGMSGTAYLDACEQLAPSFAEVPGLLAKVWLANSGTGTYGGVYLFRDRAAMEDFRGSELFSAVAASPNFVDITARDFAVLDGPTRVTQAEVHLPVGAGAT